MKRPAKPIAVSDSELNAALRRQAALIPISDADVEACERLNEENSMNTYTLLSPAELLRRGFSSRSLPARNLSQEGSAEENLARAAREGGTVSAEVEAIMRRDREAAREERVRDKADDGHK